MAELTPLQAAGVWAGIAGFVLSVINAIQTWLRNRPVASMHPDTRPASGVAAEVTIENPSSRSITIVRSTIWPKNAHDLYPADRDLSDTVRAAAYNEINWVIPPRSSQRFTLVVGEDKGFLLLIHWHSNAAFLFSRVPLFMSVSGKRWERMRRAGRTPAASTSR